jgi:hypothetical protein
MAKQQFLKSKTGTIRLTVYENNRPLIPTTPKITLYKPDGSTLQAQDDATVNSTTGEMTYSITASHSADLDLDYIAEWEYTVNSETRYEKQLFDVVLSILSIPIVDDDLYKELDSLRNVAPQDVSTATGGAAGTIIDTEKRKEPDDFWTGGTVEIIEGTGEGQKREISDYVQSTSVVSVALDWETTPDTTSIYRIVKSYTNKIVACFDKFEQMLYDKGNRHELIMESSQIKIPLTYLTVHFIALDLRQEVDDKWDLIATDYWKKFESAFGTLKLSYDLDESGTIDDEESQHDINSVRVFRT